MFEVRILGTGSYAPDNVVKNKDISKLVDTNDEWIVERTGIRERRVSTGEETSMLSVEAARRAIKDAGISPEDIELIIVATATPDNFIPSTACMVQKELEAKNATCFDVSAACTGFIYAVSIATQFIKTGQIKTALVIGAETLSKILNWEDRNTCILFGDGAGAAVLQRSDKQGIISLYTGSDGTGGEHLVLPAVQLNNPYCKSNNDTKNFVSMNGREIFKFATKIVIKCIEEVLKDTPYTLEDIKYIIPHQANAKIIEFVAKKLKVDNSKFYINLDRYGNTSGASIPIALDEVNKKGLLSSGDKIILVGFGGGLTFGAQLIEWS
ncbi:3-oxoacyl-[acyl-carrier-protein] synthase 3 [Clostridium homopropionicum DSM 5847]|uniref:Beta-ketoacyl-[acyl-carrier-protein] synthase III n=1 Tax=Clostridium homopropionicum DSM 5847 TaxID=1121318 RepID=A0A0L6Z8A6_9CLOT|nr:beta-ketoacyl-ACP synthase III [Clostridium homopropionicum]KOA19058.1 3-oxoacyl-[acyl-carrier-protein] synthase 3 [Clostridium homopropionicum DSM 5847]SFG91798.1 3-oxoacyl-[acyl-carrier-protein] synthase-3 [Clostridium homopropionicum]